MKSLMLKILIVLLIVFAMPVYTFAQDTELTTDYSELVNELPSDTQKAFGEIGLDNIDYSSIINLSPRKIIDYTIGLFKGGAKEPLKIIAAVIGILIIFYIASSVSNNEKQNTDYSEFIQCIILMLIILPPFTQTIISAASCVNQINSFMLMYIPIYTALISSSGQPLSSFTYSSSTLAFAEVISTYINKLMTPVISVLTVLSIYSSVDSNSEIEQLVKRIKTGLCTLMSVSCAMFVGLVNLKNKVSGSADSLALKGVKLVSGTVIPIVGSSVGEAVTSVISSFSIAKNTLGAFGIVTVLISALPSFCMMIVWYLSFMCCSFFCSVIGMNKMSKIFDSLMNLITVFNVMIIVIVLVYILLTGCMLGVKN